MQHNFLSNYCLFYCAVETGECFKLLSLLNSMSVQRLPPRVLEYTTYEGRREIKQPLRPKEKNQRTEFDLTVLRDEDVMFLHNRERTNSEARGGHMTISSRAFFDILQKNRLIGEVSPLRSTQLVLESVVWENYTISHLETAPGRSLLLLQEMFSSTLFSLNREEALFKKTRLLFEPLLELMLGRARAGEELEKFQKELRTMKALYPELEREVDKEKGVAEANYCLIYYLAIAQAARDPDPAPPRSDS